MKTTLIALTAAAALTLVPRPAVALGDKEAAILGGIIGGVVIAAAIDDALDHDHERVAVSYGHHDGRDWDRGDRHADRGGYWTVQTVKVWIPKRTYYTYDHCGNRIRHHESGYWSFRREKVWVPARGRW